MFYLEKPTMALLLLLLAEPALSPATCTLHGSEVKCIPALTSPAHYSAQFPYLLHTVLLYSYKWNPVAARQ